MSPQTHPNDLSHFKQMADTENMDPLVGASVPHGFFHGASHTTLNNPIMVDHSIGTVNVFGASDPVISRLYDASIKGTEIDSRARHPPPRCHPGTRTSITKELYSWMRNNRRKWNLVWIVGFAGVGKTAVAQTVGEWAKENSLFGAAFFFSRTRNHTDPFRLFISIAHQLALQNEQYRYIVAHQLSTDFGLLGKDMQTQFKKLLVEPLSQLKLDKKLLIIIDGLDECDGYREQCAVINLVNGAASSSTPLPVIWIICSRPEWDIKRTFFKADPPLNYWKNELTIDDSETRRDIKMFIQAGFKNILEEYTPVPGGESWPAAEDIETVVSAASGLFVYASTVIKYIGDEDYADPEGRLEAVIAFIEDSPARSITENPLHYLDKLYEQIIVEVPGRILQQALLILAFSDLYPTLPALQLANIFGLSQMQFYGLFKRLHSVLEIPPPERASRDHIQAFHTSFGDFLKSPTRAGRFTMKEQDVHVYFIDACLKVLGQTKLQYAKRLVWKPRDDSQAFSLAHHILAYCATNFLSACTNLGDAGDRDLINKIINFDYQFLRFFQNMMSVSQFYKFWLWLWRQVQKHNLENTMQPLFRTQPVFPSDHLFVKACETFAMPMRLDGGSDSSGTNFPQYALLGSGTQTMLVILPTEIEGGDKGVTFYTLDMLDKL